jgi:predicted PurR-regulated permease PerM
MTATPDPAPPVVRTQIELPFRTIARVLLIIAVILLVRHLFSVLLMLVIAILFTAALEPPVSRLQRRGLKRGQAVGVVLGALIGGLALVIAILAQPLVEQSRAFAEDIPIYLERVLGSASTTDLYQSLIDRAQEYSSNATSLSLPIGGIFAAGRSIFSGLANAVLVFVMTAYLLLDGKRVYLWAVRYLPDTQEDRVRRAIPEISRVVSGYISGLLVTTTLFGLYSFIVLTILGVPEALVLALLAGLLNAIPMVGALIATIPAVLVAATMSWTDALIVFALYIAYQQFENYFIAPRIFRSTMRISSFAVLMAVIIGGQLLGIIGVMMALSAAAAIPVIERIWIAEPRRARQRAAAAIPADPIPPPAA